MLKRIMSTVLKSHEETFDIDSNPHPQYLEKATTTDCATAVISWLNAHN